MNDQNDSSLSQEKSKRARERVRSLTDKLASLNSSHDWSCKACREEPCSVQFQIWDVEREIRKWKEDPLAQIDNEDAAQRLEDEYLAHLIASYGDVFSRFEEIVERKITIDDYGDEVLSHLAGEISTCINKLKHREGRDFGWKIERRLGSYLADSFAKYHDQKQQER